MATISFHATSILFYLVSLFLSCSAFLLARAQTERLAHLSLGQTPAFYKSLARLPVGERLQALHKQARANSIAWRIADEALRADEPYRAAAVDAVLGEVALELEARAMWPRAAVRIAAASGVLLMALAIALPRNVVVAVVMLVMGIGSAMLCMTMDRRAAAASREIRQSIDALVDVLELRPPMDAPAERKALPRSERRGRRRSVRA